LRAIRWAVAVERRGLSLAIGDAMREVMKAERLLAAGVDVDEAARSLNAWTAILDSRIARLDSFELRHRTSKLDARTPFLDTQFGDALLQHTAQHLYASRAEAQARPLK